MRIISGIARGTKLYTLEGTNTRPTLDRVKEPLFNILNFKLQDAIVLDLFAGSGALGLEAISRGASRAIFGECNRNAANVVEKNIEKTRFQDKSILIRNDFEKVLKQIANDKIKVDVVFLDPPYETDLVRKALDQIIDLDILNEDAVLVIETDEPQRIQKELDNININILDVRKYGRVSLIFIKRKG